MRPSDSTSLLAVLDDLDVGLIVIDAQRRVSHWNNWLTRASGVTAQAAVGQSINRLFPQSSLARLISAIEDALDAGASSLLTHALHPELFPLKTRAGRDLSHNVSVRPLGEKPYAGCVVQITDVTASSERERVLRTRQNARYDAVVESAPDPILTIDSDGRIQLANPAAAREFRYPAAELMGMALPQVVQPSAAWDEAWRKVWLGEPVQWPVELVVRRKDGSQSFVDASASRWLSGSGVFVTAILRDVNERRVAEANLRLLNETLEERVRARTGELERAHEQLRQSQKVEAIGQLTGGIAHDFNNLLTPILGGLDVLQRRGVGDARSQRLIEGALQSAERARLLVQRLLAFARRQPLQPCAVDIAGVIADMSDLIGSTLGPRIRIITQVAEDLPAARADPNQLEMALLNLAVNARDAMPDGGALTMSAREARPGPGSKLQPGPYVVLSVADTGFGMDSETLGRAIEPFFSTKGIGKGTGLGLSMIHGLAAQLGGGLDIASTPGVGTAVEIWLPAADGTEASGVAAPEREGEDPGAGLVLLVDDEDLTRDTIAHMLIDLGYAVRDVSSATDALPHVRDPRVAILITDHVMPGMTGMQLAREAQAQRPTLPILIVSGFAELEELAPDLPRLMKPFREAELAAALATMK